MKFGEFKSEEFLRVTITATLIVLASRWLINESYLNAWIQQIWAIGQQRISLLRPATQSPIPTNAPPAIQTANQSVVMLTGNQSIGSGVILTSNGLVLTNSHVVREGGNSWKVRLFNQQELPARIVAVGNRQSGIHYDLALIQIEGVSNLPTARFSEALPQAGQPVWAIGAPYGRADVVTHGEVKQMTIDGIVLTNTEVHPGNSGGPLLNEQGEVIGINTEINPKLRPDATTASISVSVLEKQLPQLVQQ